MSLVEILLIVFIAIFVFTVIISNVIAKKKGKGCCNCSSCACANKCRKKK